MTAWPALGMHVHFAVLGLLAAGIALGLFYRACIVLFSVGFAYVFVLEAARYLNHFYLILLLALLLAVCDPHRAFALDARRRPGQAPVVPWWQLALLRTQLAIVYVYAGIAKLNPDWLAGEPMRLWLSRRTGWPVIGPWLDTELAVAFFSHGGLLFDLSVVPLLLWRRTRWLGYAGAVFFHLMNAWLFAIGIFPWLMIAATTLFFEPDWPRRVAHRVRRLLGRRTEDRAAVASGPVRPPSRLVAAGLALYLVLQLAIPLRHFAIPGWAHWTEEGHFFSWRMMLREKRAEGVLLVTDAEGEPIGVVNPRDQLPRWQASAVIFRPELLRQYAHHVRRRMQEQGHSDVRVHARITASLNGRPRQLLLDPDVDLSAEPRSLGPAPWIMPLRPTEADAPP